MGPCTLLSCFVQDKLLGGAGAWVLGLALGLGCLLGWLLRMLQLHLGLWVLFQLYGLVVVDLGLGWLA